MMWDIRFFREQRAGLYKNCRYPNLIEIADGFPICYHAHVTEDLMMAVFRNEEDLTAEELFNIARYTGVPFSVLLCPKLITLDRSRPRHWQMMKQLEKKLYEIWELEKRGSKEASKYLRENSRIGRDEYIKLNFDFINGRTVTYGRYLSVRHKMNDVILFAECELKPKPRSRNRGQAHTETAYTHENGGIQAC